MPQAGATTFTTVDSAGRTVVVTPTSASTGTANAGQVPALASTGKFDPSLMPTGIGADVVVLPATEALSAGAFVNIYSASGTESVRNADNSAANAGKVAMGFVLAAVASGANASVYLNGVNSAVSGQTPGPVFLGTAGAATSSPPTASGSTLQNIGDAVSATAIHFARGNVVIL